MLRIIQGGAKTGKSTRIQQELLSRAKQEDGLLLFVPEQFSFETERTYVELLGLANAAKIRVVSFERFTDDIFREFGGLAGEIATDTARLITMKLSLQQCKGQLDTYSRFAAHPDFPMQMVHTVAEFKNAGLSCLDAEQAQVSLEDGILRRKLSDLEILWTVYESMLAEHYLDGLDNLSRAALLCAEHNWFAGKKIWLDGFKSFTAVQERIIGIMLRQHAEVTVTLPIGSEEPDNRFAVPFETAKRLRGLAYQAGEAVPKPEFLSEPVGFASPALRHFSGQILRTNPISFDSPNPDVQCVALFHEFDEAEFAAAQILEYARSGYSFEEMAILVRDLDKYGPLLEAALERYEIPFYMDRVESVDILPLFRFLCHLMKATAANFSREEMLALLKCGLLPLSLEEIAAFESYCYVWNIDHSQFLQPFSQHPAGYSAQPMTEAEEIELHTAEEVRQLVTGWISAFSAEYDQLHSWPRALFSILRQMTIPEQISEQILALQRANRQKDSDDLRRSWEVLTELLTTMDAVLADESMDLREFVSLFSVCAAGYKLGRIPQTLDSVLIGSAERVRISGKKAVLILGANDREFPLLPSSGGLFTEEEREQLALHGFPLSGNLEESILEERFITWQALSSPSDKLTITYSLGNLRGEERYPSAIVSGFRTIFPQTPVLTPQDFPPEFFCRSPRTAFLQAVRHGSEQAAFSASVREVLAQDSFYAQRFQQLDGFQRKDRFSMQNSALTHQMFGGSQILSPSQIERFYNCRFQYFCQYGLRLHSRGRAELNPLSRGNIIHFLLEQILSRGDFFTMEEKELRALIESLLEDYLREALGGEQQSKRFLYLYRRMSENAFRVLLALRAEFAQCEFVITGLEEPISFSSRIAPLQIPIQEPDGSRSQITVVGKIDRIDCWEQEDRHYFRIIDYKTGNKEFSLDEVAEGLNLQMLLYLFSIWRGGRAELHNLTPAGILYLPAKPLEPFLPRSADEEDQRTATESGFCMNGLLLDDRTVLCAMEKDLQGRFLPVSMGKNKMRGTKWLAALEDFENLEWYAIRLIEAMKGALLAGEIAPNPIQSGQRIPCRYCEFRALCGREPTDSCRLVRSTSLEEIAAIRRESEKGEDLI
ncbi:MAG: PD-(D/E)XK nuclease family protein [Candidatus Merdivicinus sp.]|jgi:ATP-dependent helicase/nuclease subunit B